MRVNVYTEELLPFYSQNPSCVEIVTAKYISSRTGQEMINYGLRIFMKSAPELHYIPDRDDDRSAITFWVGKDLKDIYRFIDGLRSMAKECEHGFKVQVS